MIVGYESQWIATRLGSYEIIYGDYHKYNDSALADLTAGTADVYIYYIIGA